MHLSNQFDKLVLLEEGASTMEIIGSFEAKTHWSALLNKVALGQEIIITKRGKPVARIIPEATHQSQTVHEAIKRIKQLRKTTTLNKLDWKELRDKGRK